MLETADVTSQLAAATGLHQTAHMRASAGTPGALPQGPLGQFNPLGISSANLDVFKNMTTTSKSQVLPQQLEWQQMQQALQRQQRGDGAEAGEDGQENLEEEEEKDGEARQRRHRSKRQSSKSRSSSKQ